MYDAERYDINGKWYRYKTDVFYGVHGIVGSFKHRTVIGGYIGTIIRVKWHKLTNTN